MNMEFLTEGIKRTPYQHQLEAVSFLRNKPEGFLFFEMGTGKTGTAVLTYRAWNQREFRQLRCLVISPSVVIHNWRDEFGLFSKMDLNDVLPLAKGSGKHKAELVYDKFVKDMKSGVIITNYEALLTQELFTAIQRWNPEVIIFDEAQYLKNPSAKRSKLCRKLAENAIYRLGLTGTPILKNVMDIYGIFSAIDLGKTFGNNQYIFQARYLIDKNAHWKSKSNYFPKWENNPNTYAELNDLVYKKSLRKLKSECLDLPELIKTVRLVEWGKDQKKAYDELKRDFLTFIQTSKENEEPASVTANLAMTKALRMLQVASGFVQTDDGNIHEFTDVPRLEECKSLLAEIVGDNEQKCILWCSYKHNYKMLARICDELGFKYVFITGEQNTTEKREAELAFRDNPEVKVAICNRRAGGVGVNLVAASHSIVYSRNFSLEEELQSEARNYRSGSERHESIVKIDLAVKDSIDEEIMLALSMKHQVSTDILDMVR